MSIAYSLAVFLAVFGAILFVCGQVWLLVEAFAESIVYGILCLIFPLAQLLFIAFFPGRASWPLAMMGAGFAALLVAGFGVFPLVA